MVKLPPASLIGFARVLYVWMLDRGYMVDPEEGFEVVADKVEQWDAIELIHRLEADGFAIEERQL